MGEMKDKIRAFNEILQKNLNNYLTEVIFGGKKRVYLTQKQATILFKMCLGTPLQFLTEIWTRMGLDSIPESYTDIQKLHKILAVTITRFGKFSLHFHKPRRTQGRDSKLHGKMRYIPQYKFAPSRSIKNILVKELTGLDLEEVKAAPVPKRASYKARKKVKNDD